MDDFETIIYTEDERRICVSVFDNGVWLGLQGNGHSSSAILTRDEAIVLVDGLQTILEATK